MGHIPKKVRHMQEALRTRSLQPKEEDEAICTEKVLVGKILATRSFRRYTLSEIVQKTWKTKERV